MPKLCLGINIDHVATLRNARNRKSIAKPDVLRAAEAAIKGGADSITFHLREDRRHILDEDVKRLRKDLKMPINLEIAATKRMKAIALKTKPKAVCLVPEKRQEITTEGGLDVMKGGEELAELVNDLAASGIEVSLFISPDLKQVRAAFMSGAKAIELHTGRYAETIGKKQTFELTRLKKAAHLAASLGLKVHAGHGLTFENVAKIASIKVIEELNIGHFLIGEALFCGLTESVRKMRQLMTHARSKAN